MFFYREYLDKKISTIEDYYKSKFIGNINEITQSKKLNLIEENLNEILNTLSNEKITIQLEIELKKNQSLKNISQKFADLLLKNSSP